MKHIVKTTIAAAALAALAAPASAQEQELPYKVEDIEVLDLRGQAATIPHFGEKNLLIFYVDPDKYKQNDAFTHEMEENHRVEGDNLYGLGVLNLADTGFPNKVVRWIARKRTEKNGATILSDEKHIMRDAWDLGDCNNQFVMMVVSKEGELVYCHKGEHSREEIDEFYEFIQSYL